MHAYQVLQKASVVFLTGKEHQTVHLVSLDLFVVLHERIQITVSNESFEFGKHVLRR